jgi:hypothetical protein
MYDDLFHTRTPQPPSSIKKKKKKRTYRIAAIAVHRQHRRPGMRSMNFFHELKRRARGRTAVLW